MVKTTVEALKEKKGYDIKVIDISEISILADYFIIANGNNTNQVQAMVDNVEEQMYKAGFNDPKVEGYNNASWILLDYNDIVIHVFDDESRSFYNLERLWKDGKEVDIDNLYISQPDSGEQALEITESMVRSGAVDIIIVDSVAALVPKAEIEGEMGDSHVGLQARLMSQALRKLTSIISKSNCIVIFINQLREKVGVMFGSPETTTGGRALKFYSSIRLDVRRMESLKQGGEIIGNHTRIKVVKNKVAPPFKEAEFDIMFGKGISKEGDILDLAAQINVVNKSGAWYAYNGEKIGQGRENSKNYLKENPAICDEIEQKVRDFYQLDGSIENENEAAEEAKTAAKAEKKAEKKQESEE